MRFSKISLSVQLLIPAALYGAAGRPNIVFMLADDLGYGDPACFNPAGKIRTPNIDRLSRKGMRFTDAHSAAAVCTPSRYGILTGRYPWRTHLQRGVLKIKETRPSNGTLKIGAEPLIRPDILTVPQFLKANGYDTAAFGKWHLGFFYRLPAGKKMIHRSNHRSAAPVGTRVIDGPITRGFDVFAGFHHAGEMCTWIEQDRVTEVLKTPAEMLGHITDAAVGYITAPERRKKPFFIYLPFNSPHGPIVPTPKWQDKSGLSAYADYVMETDAAVGRVLDALDRAGLRENTIVFFTSDNGCSPVAKIDRLRKAGHDPEAGLRGHKADIWEGGHRVPYIVRFPGTVAPGTTCSAPICLNSLMATCADVIGKQLPDNAGVDSFSILPLLQGRKVTYRHQIIHASIKGKLAVRTGDWKYAACRGSGGWSRGGDEAPEQLYNLKTDLKEEHNLYKRNPEKLQAMRKTLENAVKSGATVPTRHGTNDVPVTIFGN